MMKNTVIPMPLVDGDRVSLVAPAGLVNRDDIENAITTIESWGLKVKRGKNLYEKYGIFAGTDSQRLADIQNALDDADTGAIICARGGYGVSRIIRDIDFSMFRKNPKWIVGYSDISVLHLFVNCKLHIASLHAEMPLNFHKLAGSSVSLSSLKESLFGEEKEYEWHPGRSKEGQADGIITGGNLSLLINMLGTEIKDYLKGKILFIEERGEYTYSLDRMITGLDIAGVLKNIKGLVIGGLTDIKESEIKYSQTTVDIIMDAAGKYDYPVAFDFPAGHIEDNMAFVLGAGVRLTVKGNKSSLKYLK